MIYLQGTQYKKAERALLAARNILEKESGGGHSMHLATVFRTFSLLYQKMGKIGKSEEFKAKVKKMVNNAHSF
jgi:hypothetical protein